ncbi:MAG: hypothetical protein JW904_13575 [Spirochaetales bacterium]|nr:hypothetical protein [Spirochaetales bacterium]
MGNHRAGGKITRSHTTLIDHAARIVDAIHDRPEVTKISLGMISNIGRGKPGIKFLPITGGFKLVVRGNISKQELFVYTKDPEVTRMEVLSAIR